MMKLLTWKLLLVNYAPCTQSENCVPNLRSVRACLLIVTVELVNRILLMSYMMFFLPLRIPVIQALSAEVKQTTQSLLSQLLQKLRSNIQVLIMCLLIFLNRGCFF